jgi:biopolymer transport protein ExbD
MIEEILRTRKKKHVQDLNIVPILDMLTTVIFFLLMSTTFIEYTKLTLPPAATSSAKGPGATRPLNPKLHLRKTGATGEYLSSLSWAGTQPDHSDIKVTDQNMGELVKEQIKKFSEKYPSEKTLQISLDRTIRYQALISVMDAAREHMPDPVLTSYADGENK